MRIDLLEAFGLDPNVIAILKGNDVLISKEHCRAN
jgi:hypothetical protein